MIVPFNKSPSGQSGQPQAQPSEANLLMALATMHKMGRLTKPDQSATIKPEAQPDA